MKTATIAWRVADFSRAYPPFQYMEDEELLALVADGRVVFHEDGEYIFQQGHQRGPRIWVIQQGVVRLVEAGSDGGEVLRDVRGEGDLLGMGRFLGIGEYLFGRRVSAGLAACGYASSTKGIVAGHPSACRSAASAQRTHPPGTMRPRRCRTGTYSNSSGPTSSPFANGISASRGRGRLSQATVQPVSSAGGRLRRRCVPQHTGTRAPAPRPTSVSPAVGR